MKVQDLDKHARYMRSKVFNQMLSSRSSKYRAFLRYLHLFKYITLKFTRGNFLESYYTLMRYLDDIVDGDAVLPEGYLNSAEYIKEKINFSENPISPKDEVDYLMLHCFQLAKKFNQDFRFETKDILNSLLFDANRKGKLIIFPEKDLFEHFHKLDIEGTIKATLKIFNENPEKSILIEPLGIASRYQFDLEDFEDDIKAGYVNISKEECQQFEIEPVNFHDKESASIKKWFYSRAEKGLSLLNEHHKKITKGNFSLLIRLTFFFVYELPARRVFHKILSEKSICQDIKDN